MTTTIQTTQEKIHEYIKAHPGVYRSKIAEALELKLAEIEIHL